MFLSINRRHINIHISQMNIFYFYFFEMSLNYEKNNFIYEKLNLVRALAVHN